MTKKILIIDDDEDLIALYLSVLKNEGYNPVDPGLNAENIAKETKDADLVISDFHMGKLSFDQVRNIVEGENKPLLLLSGDPEKRYEVQLNRTDGTEMLLEMIKKLLD